MSVSVFIPITTAAPTSTMCYAGTAAGSTVVCRSSRSCSSRGSRGSSRRRRIPTLANWHLVRIAATSVPIFTTGFFTFILSKLLNPRLHLVLVPNLPVQAAEQVPHMEDESASSQAMFEGGGNFANDMTLDHTHSLSNRAKSKKMHHKQQHGSQKNSLSKCSG